MPTLGRHRLALALALAAALLAPRAARALDLAVDCTTSSPLAPFWRSVGYTPATYALRDDELENTLLIGCVPNLGVEQVRIHYLLDLVAVLGFAPAAPNGSTPSGWALDYDFADLDHALDVLAASDLRPGFELMGSPRGFPALPVSFWQQFNGNGHIQPEQTLAMFRQLVGDVLARCVRRYGAASVSKWHIESWNEPDQGWGWDKVQNSTDPVLASFVAAWDAATAGLEDAEDATGAKLYFGGTASGRAAGDAYFLPAVLAHAAGGRNAFNGRPVRLDYISAHVKGESTSFVTVEGEWGVSALVRSQPAWVAAGLGALPVSNDEGDPMVGWETPEDWRGDARYAAIIPKMVNQHLLAINDNATSNNPLGWLSFDGAFMNGVGDDYTGFGMRTMSARFGAPASRGPFGFVRKSGLAAFALLSRLGDTRCAGVAGAPADVLHANAGAIATTRIGTTGPGGDAAQAAIIVYNSADCNNDTSPALDVGVSLVGLPFVPVPADGSVVAVPFVLDQDAAHNPAAAWVAMGSPAPPTSAQLQALWAAAANMTRPAGAPVPVAVGAGGAVTLPRAGVALPGLLLWHVAERASAPAAPVAPPRVVAFAKAANASFISGGGAREVMVRWSCADASRVIGSYVVQSAPAASGPWATVGAPADIVCSFSFAASAAQAEGSFFRVAGVDYWQRQGAWSAPVVATPWPTYGSA